MKGSNMRITAEIDGLAVISTTEISKRLGLQVSSTALKKAGVEPFAVMAHGTYWRESQMREIRQKLSAYILVGPVDELVSELQPMTKEEGLKFLFDTARQYGWKG